MAVKEQSGGNLESVSREFVDSQKTVLKQFEGSLKQYQFEGSQKVVGQQSGGSWAAIWWQLGGSPRAVRGQSEGSLEEVQSNQITEMEVAHTFGQ